MLPQLSDLVETLPLSTFGVHNLSCSTCSAPVTMPCVWSPLLLQHLLPQAPAKADILVSELLGSFGDNELSPECLDGAQRFLAPSGVSIPSSYTSYLAPLTAWKLFDAVRAYKDLEHCETPYVVKPHR
jgi:hypothetical protein